MLDFDVLLARKSRNMPAGLRQGRIQVLYVSQVLVPSLSPTLSLVLMNFL